jgi:N-acetylmuramoyl-L-alanine amidase
MANVERLKRRLMRDLVQENLDLRHGRLRPPPQHRRDRRGLRLAAALAVVMVSVTLLGSAQLLSNLAGSPPRPAEAHAAPLRTAGAAGLLATAALAGPAGSGLAGSAPGARLFAASGQALRLSGIGTAVDPAVFPLAVRKVAIDAGHGGSSQGTRTSLGLLEKDVTLDIAERVRRLLEQRKQFQVVLTRQDDRTVSLQERAAIANRAGADIFLSIHVNWIGQRDTRGVETYFLGPTNDPFLTRLAAAENRDSGYSLADARDLLERIYAGVRQDQSRRLAEKVQSSLFGSLGRLNPKLENRGIKSAPFIVLLTTQMPAILAEVSCMSNDEEAQLLAKPLYRQYIAEALAAGLKSYAASAAGSDEKGS